MIDIVQSNYVLPACFNTVSDWAHQNANEKVGIALRTSGSHKYHFVKEEKLVDLGINAIAKTLQEAEISPKNIDALIMFQTSPCNTLPMPHTLVGQVREKSGLINSWAFAITQQQCVSPIHALRIIDALFAKHNDWNYVLLVGVDTILREELRAIGVAGLHSDAASAMLIGRPGTGSSVLAIETYNDPRAVVGIHEDGSYGENSNYLWSLISIIRRISKSAKINLAACKSILPHNVNKPAWAQALEAMRVPKELLYEKNFSRIGHAFGSDAAINIHDSKALTTHGKHLVFASGIGGCFGGFVLETGDR